MRKKKTTVFVFLTAWIWSAACLAQDACKDVGDCVEIRQLLPTPSFPLALRGGQQKCFVVSNGCLVKESFETTEAIGGDKRRLIRVTYAKEGEPGLWMTWAVDGELLVAADSADEAAALLGISVGAGDSESPCAPDPADEGIKVFLVKNLDLDEMIPKLESKRTDSNKRIDAFYNGLVSIAATGPVDPYLSSQAYLERIGLTRVYEKYTDVPWRAVKVAIVDNGVSAKLVDGVPMDVPIAVFERPESKAPFHGTMMAGIVFSIANNGLRLAGFRQQQQDGRVNPVIEPLIVRAFDDSGLATEAEAMAGVCRAANDGADVILGAWVAEEESLPGVSAAGAPIRPFEGLWQALKKVHSKGALWVTAAGNREGEHTQATYPAAFKKISEGGYRDSLLVAGATSTDVLYDQEDRIVPGTTWGKQIDLGAPGRHLYSLNLAGDIANVPPGTSGAAAMAAGAAALVFAANPNFTGAEVLKRLVEKARPMCSLCGCFPGGLRLDIGNALLMDQRYTACTKCDEVTECSSHGPTHAHGAGAASTR